MIRTCNKIQNDFPSKSLICTCYVFGFFFGVKLKTINFAKQKYQETIQ